MAEKESFQSPRGTKDILPSEQYKWDYFISTAEGRVKNFGYSKLTTPVFENVKIFERTSGQTSDIVQKQMYAVGRYGQVVDKEDEKTQLVLKPELTPSIARAYIQHGMQTLPQPVKLFTMSPVFRYERPQKGRFRIHHQFDVEALGDENPGIDASSLLMLWQIFQDLGISDKITIELNTIGCASCRPKIKKKILAYYQNNLDKLCEDCQRRYITNPLRLLDCKNMACQTVARNAPQLLDLVCLDCRNHFKAVLEYIDELNINYTLNPRLVRGLDYYTRTVFEVIDTGDEQKVALGGGGRYDDLIELLGGPKTPAFGFGMGIDRIIDTIDKYSVKIPKSKSTQVFVIQLGDQARKKVLPVISKLTNAGISVDSSLNHRSLRSQLTAANKAKAPLAIIIGQREAFDNTVILKDMASGIQETVPTDDLERIIRKRLEALES